jgi:hypothetical protein
MMEMNWIHSSKTAALGVLLATVLIVSGTAGAVSFEAQPPESTQVGDSVSMEVTMTDAFEDPLPNSYTLQATTALNDAGFTIRATNVAGDTVIQEDVASDTATLQLNSQDGIDEVTIIVEGDVPQMSEFNYQDLEVENYTAMKLSRVVDNGTSQLEGGVWSAHRYTEQSQKARTAIDEANASVQDASSSEAEDDLERAIAAYNSGNFQNAVSLAEDAQDTAEGNQQTTQLLLIGGAVIVLVAVVGGGAYVWKQRQQDTSKLR